MTERDNLVKVWMSDEEKRIWEGFQARVGPNLGHREAMLRAAQAAEYLEEERNQAFREAFL